MTTQTFLFLTDQSDSDGSDFGDETRLLKDKGEGHRMKTVHFTKQIQQEEPNNNTGPVQNGHIGKNNKKRKKYDKTKQQNGFKPANQIKSVNDGIEQLEKCELAKKRRMILYQLMAVSAVAMLHGLSVIPYFWNSILLNIYDLTTQTVCLWVILVTYFLSCIITPFIINRLSIKWILVTGCLTAAVFTAARFYPKIYLIAPAAFIMGLSLSPFYTSVFKHICQLSTMYEGYQGPCYKDNVYTFTAVCYGWMSLSAVWLSMLHIVIYNIVGGDSTDAIPLTSVDCGFSYLWEWTSHTKDVNGGLSPEIHSIQAMLGSCLVCSLGGILLTIIAVDSRTVPVPHHTQPTSGERLQQEIRESVQDLRDSNHLLLYPVFFATGTLEIFSYTLFGQAFMSCNFGSDSLYYMVLCISLTASLTTIAAGLLYRKVASVKVVTPVYVLTLVLLLVLTFGGYMPFAMYFITGALLGVINYILTTQVTALVLLHTSSKIESSFSLMQSGRCLAFLVTFILVRYQGDNSTLMLAVLGTVFIGCFCHVILEVRMRLLQKQESGDSDRSGAYVLLGKAPWIPEVDPTAVKAEQTQSLLPRLPTKEEEEQCNQQ